MPHHILYVFFCKEKPWQVWGSKGDPNLPRVRIGSKTLCIGRDAITCELSLTLIVLYMLHLRISVSYPPSWVLATPILHVLEYGFMIWKIKMLLILVIWLIKISPLFCSCYDILIYIFNLILLIFFGWLGAFFGVDHWISYKISYFWNTIRFVNPRTDVP